MRYNLKAPCAKCPFRNDVKPYITPARAREICNVIVERQGTFACHETIDYSKGEGVETKATQHCAGAMIMLEHMEKPNQMMRIMERFGDYDHRKLKMDSPVFKSDKEMINYYRGKKVA